MADYATGVAGAAATAGIEAVSTHSHAVLELSKSAYDEIHKKLHDAGYDQAWTVEPSGRCVIDMHGIAVTQEDECEKH